MVHSALYKLLSIKEYNIQNAYVFSNERRVYTENRITYMPVYYIMFLHHTSPVVGQFPE